jgi:hypothetical protein
MWILITACGAVHGAKPDASPSHDGSAGCVAASDAELCTRAAATCDPIAATDNCGAQRQVDCGACSGTNVCVAHACKVPACPALTFPTKNDVLPASSAGSQNIVNAITPDGTTWLVQNDTNPIAMPPLCDLGGIGLLEIVDGGTAQSVSGIDNMETATQTALALSSDGLSIIGIDSATQTHFLVATRASKATGTFVTASASDFAALAVTGSAHVSAPVISPDGLAFYFTVTGDATAGIYETVRASTSTPFPAATKLTGDLASLAFVSSVSSDLMTLIVADNTGAFGVATRSSVTRPFTLQQGVAMPPQARLLGDCTGVYATCSVGGGGNTCPELDLCLFSR